MSDTPSPADPTAGLSRSVRRFPVTWVLGTVNVVVFLLTEAAGGSTNLDVMVRVGAQTTALLASGQLWRLLTSAFLHFGAFHLLANMWGLVIFGPLLERAIGKTRFAGLYLATALAGSATTALLGPQQAVSAGASGAIFGLLGAFAVLGMRLRDTPTGRVWTRHAVVLVVLNVVLGLTDPTIGLEAHLGGLAAGAAITVVETWRGIPARRTRRGPARYAGLAASVLVAFASVVLAASLT